MKMKSSDDTVEASKRRFSCKVSCGFLKEGRGRLYIFRRSLWVSLQKNKTVNTIVHRSQPSELLLSL
ncbi:hypothetical protein ACE6H2_018436 [Prunus campanulata]